MKIAEKLREKGKRVVDDREALDKLLKCHPFPRYQGPFTNTMEGKMYEFDSPEEDTYDFISYTTFKHRKTQKCQIWEVIEQDHDKLKLHLSFNTSPVTKDYRLSGPASRPNMAIMYTCQKGKCVIVCPCIVCCNLSRDCRKKCKNNPCKECSAQCFDHHVDVPRKFNPETDSFTIPCYSKTFEPPRVEPTRCALGGCSNGRKYAGIPRDCDKCRVDLLDHQINHHVAHDRCKFCKVELRILDKDVSVEVWENMGKIERNDLRTCGFCYKVFARIKGRKLHELMEHNSYDGTPSRRREVCQSKDKKRLHCENCDRSFASEKALKYHSIQAHAKSIKQHICNKCDKQFKSDKTLKRHILCLHENSSLHECYICMEIFTRKDNLKRHKADVHQLSQSQLCP